MAWEKNYINGTLEISDDTVKVCPSGGGRTKVVYVDYPIAEAKWTEQGKLRVILTDESIRDYSDFNSYFEVVNHMTALDWCVIGAEEELDEFSKFIHQLCGGYSFHEAFYDLVGCKSSGNRNPQFTDILRTKTKVEFKLCDFLRSHMDNIFQFDLLRFRWPKLQFLFMGHIKNIGNHEIYATNDVDGIHFPERLRVVCVKKVNVGGVRKYLFDKKFFAREEEALRHIGEFMGGKTPKSIKAAKSISIPDDKYAYCRITEVHLVDNRGEKLNWST